ncbi:MAG: hypothetical protein ACRCUS_04710, partial [Anaerovoracaceae bacterium]
DECIRIINRELDKEELKLIPDNYEVIKHDYGTVYRSMINKHLMLRCVKYNDVPGLVRIGIISLYEQKSGVDGNNSRYTRSKKAEKMAQRYYEIICDNVMPKFNANRFIRVGDETTAGMNLETNGIVFFHSSFSRGSGSYNESLEIFEVLSSESFYLVKAGFPPSLGKWRYRDIAEDIFFIKQ